MDETDAALAVLDQISGEIVFRVCTKSTTLEEIWPPSPVLLKESPKAGRAESSSATFAILSTSDTTALARERVSSTGRLIRELKRGFRSEAWLGAASALPLPLLLGLLGVEEAEVF